MAQLNNVEFEQELGVTKWFASSGNHAGVHSAIVNIRAWHDRRRTIKVHVYYDYKLQNYVIEGAK